MFTFTQKTSKRLFCLALVVALAACGAPTTPEATVARPPTQAPQIETATIAPTATNTRQPAPSATSTLAPPFAQDIVSEVDTYLNKLANTRLFSGSVLIARNGDVLVSNGYGEADREKHVMNTAQTKFRLGSITKQFTAMAILILQARGELDVQDPICTYLSDCPATWQDITIHHLLTHTSGIPEFTSFPDYETTKGSPSSPTETIARFKEKPLDFQPGEKWSYSNSGYIVLGAIIEQASGETYEAFLHESIFQPLKMMDTGYDHNNEDLAIGYRNTTIIQADFIDMSIVYAAGGLYSTVEDLYRWDQALYTDKLIPKDSLDKMFTPYAPIPDNAGWGYGYGWAIGREVNHQVVSHGGGIDGFTTAIARYLDDKVVVIVLGNQEDVDTYGIGIQLAKVVFGEK